eukprot:12363070-Ditylum_brightwellii.AAC.1
MMTRFQMHGSIVIQIKSRFKNEELNQLANDIGITFNKQCTKRSTCEQGADVGEMFKLMKM